MNGTKEITNDRSFIAIIKGLILGSNSSLKYENDSVYHYGDITNNASVNTTPLGKPGESGLYCLAGASSQLIKGSLNTTFENLKITGTGGVAGTKILQQDIVVKNVLNLQKGILNTGIYEVFVSNELSNAVINNSVNSYIIGKLKRRINAGGATGTGYDFPLGDATNYQLATLDFQALTGVSDIQGTFHTGLLGTIPDTTFQWIPIGDTVINGNTEVVYKYVKTGYELMNGGFWSFTPYMGNDIKEPDDGLFSITLKLKGSTNAPGTYDPNFLLMLKRNSTPEAWQFQGTFNPINQSILGGIITVRQDSLSYFCDVEPAYSDTIAEIALPLEMLTFSAKPNKDIVNLQWITASEINNNFFTVERSKDGVIFEDILDIKSKGNSTQKTGYFANDENPYPGWSFYRLKQTDYDGKYTYSNIVPVYFKNNYNKSSDFTIYPNPNNGRIINVKIFDFNNDERVDIKISNTFGNVVQYKNISTDSNGNYQGSIVPDMNLSKGIYFITCTQKDKRIIKKIIIE